MRNNSIKFFEFGSVVHEMSFKRFLIWSFGNFERGHYGEHSSEVI